MGHVIMPKGFKALLLSVVFATGFAGAAMAATLLPVNLADPLVVLQDDDIGAPEQNQLFAAEVKRDKNLNNGNQAGDDAILRNGTASTGGSFNYNWGNSGSVETWSLSYTGTQATLQIGNRSETLAISQNANWNALRFFLRADDLVRFSSSTTTVTVGQINGQAADAPFSLSVTNNQSTATFALANFGGIQSISGTIRFDFARRAQSIGSPGSALSFGVAAIAVTPVPVPASLPLLAAALGGIALTRRRTRSVAA